MSATYSIEQFLPHIGSVFVAHTDQGTHQLNLYRATELPRKGLPEIFPTPISLLFSVEQNALQGQSTYTLEHPQLGQVKWLLVPVIAPTSVPRIDTQPTLHYYEAIFS